MTEQVRRIITFNSHQKSKCFHHAHGRFSEWGNGKWERRTYMTELSNEIIEDESDKTTGYALIETTEQMIVVKQRNQECRQALIGGKRTGRLQFMGREDTVDPKQPGGLQFVGHDQEELEKYWQYTPLRYLYLNMEEIFGVPALVFVVRYCVCAILISDDYHTEVTITANQLNERFYT
ncbi:MAG: hypothetical protein K0U41_07090 [Gammaproteobacteria bacterium]|nr:hypothetical protein [Gammaproteobacteria bacterium]